MAEAAPTSRAAPEVPTEDALRTVLREHARWVESGGSEGTQADFSGMNLTRVDLSRAQLSGAVLRDARLRGANLKGADLEDADLRGAQLQGADLTGADLRRSRLREANFRDAILADADLTATRGLLGGQVGGANLAGTKLPDDVAKFEGLANVTEASKTTQGLFYSILLVCAYTWMTVASTRDAQLLNNAAPPSSRLPILGTDIPLVQFYLVAPLLLLCLFVYFHLCLQRLWEEMGDLPAIFPDGRAVDKRAYPWLMNVLVRAHAPRLKGLRTNMALFQGIIAVALAWGLVPMTVAWLWGRYLRGHDWWVTLAQIAVLACSIGAAFGFHRLAAATLRGAERRRFQWRAAWRDARARGTMVTLGSAALLLLLSFGAIEGYNPANRGVDAPRAEGLAHLDPRHWIPRAFLTIGYNPFAQLDDAALSIKPANWSGGNDPAEIEGVRGADLEGRNLHFAHGYNMFCVRAFMKGADGRDGDFRESDLREADLREADLRGANFRKARCSSADFRWAQLTRGRFKEADLKKARLDEVDARDAVFEGADLTGADLTAANLRGADLTDAILHQTDLAGADLTGALGLTAEQLVTAKLDEKTRLPDSAIAARVSRDSVLPASRR